MTTRTTRTLIGFTAGTALLGLLAGCSQSSNGGSSTGGTSTSAASSSSPATVASSSAAASSSSAASPVPAKFAAGGVKIALVRQLSTGDYFEQWQAGAEAEAKTLGIHLDISSANNNNDKQALNLQEAINNKDDAIIVDHGFAQTIDPAIAKAVAAKIPVVGFDVDAGKNNITTIDQSDKTIADQSLSALKQDTGGKAKVIYVYVAGYAPLDKRNAVWVQFKKDNPGIDQVAKIGVVNDNTAAQVADQAKAALQANPGVTAIFAPYDEFAKGATQAVQELGLQGKVKVYGADTSTADIGVMTAANSPWVASSATDPANVGAVAVRAAALLVAGDTVPALTEIPPALITQQQLRSGNIQNIAQLSKAIPALQTPDVLPIPWQS